MSFDPRSRAGSDGGSLLASARFPVSIHAPALGATLLARLFGRVQGVSIHAPARGATGRLALIRTLLVPLHESGELMSLVAEARILGWEYGRDLASDVPPPPQEVEPVLAAVRRFVRHPIARMTGVCSLVRRAMDESESQPVRG